MSGEETSEAVRVWGNARLMTGVAGAPRLGLVADGALAAADGRLLYAGPRSGLPAEFARAECIDCGGRLVTPGFVDCHTHLVHAGNRAAEFEMRLAGATYQEIARAGGGIVSSVKALREADEAALVAQSLPRLDALIAEGATTVEIKSGYGLSLADEMKSLAAARRLGALRDVEIRTSFLGAHALPPEFSADRDAYVDRIVDEMLPAVRDAGLADAVDGFCETIAFTPADSAE